MEHGGPVECARVSHLGGYGVQISQSFQGSGGIIPRIGHDFFLPNLFHL
jgi:hypothetical protein